MNRTFKMLVTAAAAVSILTGAVAPTFAAPPGGIFPGGITMEPHPMFPVPPGGFAPTPPGGGGVVPPAPPAPPAPHHDHDKYRNRAIAAGAAGLLVGTMLGAGMANNQRSQAPSNELPSWWVAACAKRYKSYSVADNTFMGYDGYRHWCDPR